MRARTLVLIVAAFVGAVIALWRMMPLQGETRAAVKSSIEKSSPEKSVPIARARQIEPLTQPTPPSTLAEPPRSRGPRQFAPATATSDHSSTMEERIERAEKLVEAMHRAELDAIDAVARDDEERELLLDNQERSRAGIESLADDDDDDELEDVVRDELTTRKQILGEERYVQYLKAFIVGLRSE
mgnify:CR=1 FL=1